MKYSKIGIIGNLNQKSIDLLEKQNKLILAWDDDIKKWMILEPFKW